MESDLDPGGQTPGEGGSSGSDRCRSRRIAGPLPVAGLQGRRLTGPVPDRADQQSGPHRVRAVRAAGAAVDPFGHPVGAEFQPAVPQARCPAVGDLRARCGPPVRHRQVRRGAAGPRGGRCQLPVEGPFGSPTRPGRTSTGSDALFVGARHAAERQPSVRARGSRGGSRVVGWPAAASSWSSPAGRRADYGAPGGQGVVSDSGRFPGDPDPLSRPRDPQPGVNRGPPENAA